MPGARWFPEARLNFAENLLTRRPADDAGDALVFRGEDKVTRRVAHAELVAATSRVAAALRRRAWQPATGWPPTCPTCRRRFRRCSAPTSIGAIWSSCSPDFGVQGVLDRFGQIEPRVLVTVDGYWYNGKALPSSTRWRPSSRSCRRSSAWS